jgi:hypothetical protein
VNTKFSVFKHAATCILERRSNSCGENLRNGIKNLQSRIELQQVVPFVDKYLHVPNHKLNTRCSQKWLFIYLFIYALTKDHVSISDYITSTDRAICR